MISDQGHPTVADNALAVTAAPDAPAIPAGSLPAPFNPAHMPACTANLAVLMSTYQGDRRRAGARLRQRLAEAHDEMAERCRSRLAALAEAGVGIMLYGPPAPAVRVRGRKGLGDRVSNIRVTPAGIA